MFYLLLFFCFSNDDYCFSSVDMTCCSDVKKCLLNPLDVATAPHSLQTVSCTQHTSCTRVHLWSAFAILSERVVFFASCLDEESGSLAVVIIPCLLTLSTVSVVALIFYSLHKNKARMQSANAPATHGTHSSVEVLIHPSPPQVDLLSSGNWTCALELKRRNISKIKQMSPVALTQLF